MYLSVKIRVYPWLREKGTSNRKIKVDTKNTDNTLTKTILMVELIQNR
jgi:hypothetical protein